MKIYTAPEFNKEKKDISVFLAGGITNCETWQNDVINILNDKGYTDNLIIYNPRRENFSMENNTRLNMVVQIGWEFQYLEQMDIFSMYFAGGESVQPICMYELGRNVLRMQQRFPSDWEKRIVISCEDGYKRKFDVLTQVGFATNNKLHINTQIDPYMCLQEHAENIYRSYYTLLYNR